MRYDIKGALMNALERGETLEKAMRSLVNAGYNENEVRQAASSLQSSQAYAAPARPRPNPQNQMHHQGQNQGMHPAQYPRPQNPLPNREPSQSQRLASFQNPPRIVGKKVTRPSYGSTDNKKIIILSIILVMLIIFLVFTAMFRESVINFLSSLF